MAVGTPQLRNALKKLRAVEARITQDFDPVETGQEMLDLLAVADGLKPVFLHGRGLLDPAWVEGVVAVAKTMGLRIAQGPCWNVLPPGEDFPDWYAACVEADFAAYRPFYICKAPVVLRDIEATCAAGGRPTIEREAGILGYPECCVAAHHARAALYHRFIVARIEALAGGEAARLADLYASDIDMTPRDADEERLLDAAYDIVPFAFGSWNACRSCLEADDSPSAALADDYAALAEAVDPALYRLLDVPLDEAEG